MLKEGGLIVFFGPDGSGKSTTADILQELCRNNNLEVKRYHWRPRILPSLRNNAKDFDATKPNEHNPRSALISIVMYFYFYLDFAISYLVKIRPAIKQGVIIIYERYYYDALFHPVRYKLKDFPFVGRVLSSIMPKPDLTVLLIGDPKQIRIRKPELAVDEIARQQNEMKTALPKYSRMIELDVISLNANECAKEVFDLFGNAD